MSFISNLVSGPVQSVGNILKGIGQTIVSPFTTAFSAVKTVGTVALDLITFQWHKVPGDAVKGTVNTVQSLGAGPLNVLRGTVGLGATVGGAAAGAALGPVGAAAGYAAGAQFANWTNG